MIMSYNLANEYNLYIYAYKVSLNNTQIRLDMGAVFLKYTFYLIVLIISIKLGQKQNN